MDDYRPMSHMATLADERAHLRAKPANGEILDQVQRFQDIVERLTQGLNHLEDRLRPVVSSACGVDVPGATLHRSPETPLGCQLDGLACALDSQSYRVSQLIDALRL